MLVYNCAFAVFCVGVTSTQLASVVQKNPQTGGKLNKVDSYISAVETLLYPFFFFSPYSL